MRMTLMLSAMVSLIACGSNPAETEKATVPSTPAAITYDGADAANRPALLAHGERISSMIG